MQASVGTSRSVAPVGFVASAPRASASRVSASASRSAPLRSSASASASLVSSAASSGASLRGSFGRRAAAPARRVPAPCAAGRKVALLGAAGGIGQPLALLLKLNPRIGELRLYDIANVAGVAADLSHINTAAQVSGFTGAEQLSAALADADVVIIPAGVPRKPGMTRDDLFNINAGIVRTLVEASGKAAPNAILNIISNPVNSTVPIAAEVLKSLGVFDPDKVLGVTTLDVVRAQTFAAAEAGVPVERASVPVVGGHAGETILPLFSRAKPAMRFDQATLEALTTRTQNAGTEVVEAKAGAGSATLSMAYAAAVFAEQVLRGLDGEKNVTACAYVQSDVMPGFDYFAQEVVLGPQGVAERLPLGDLSEFERQGLEKMKGLLAKNIAAGEGFIKNKA